MANYVYVENNIPIEFHDLLPKNWKNISGLNLITDDGYLKNLGWYKVIKNEVNYNPENQQVTGYTYSVENGEVYETPVVENFEPQPQQVYVPQQISATQIRLWLIKNNIPLSAVEGAINSIEDPLLKEELMIKWEYVPYFERDNPFINNVGSALGLTPGQIDQAFIEASNY